MIVNSSKPTLNISLKESPVFNDYLWEVIGHYLSASDLFRLRQTCWYLHESVPDWNQVWFRQYARHHLRGPIIRLEHQGPIKLGCVTRCLQRPALRQLVQDEIVPATSMWRYVYRNHRQDPLPDNCLSDYPPDQICRKLNHWLTDRPFPWHKYDPQVDWFAKFYFYKRDQSLQWHRKHYQDYMIRPTLLLKRHKVEQTLAQLHEAEKKLKKSLIFYDRTLEALPQYLRDHPHKGKKSSKIKARRTTRQARLYKIRREQLVEKQFQKETGFNYKDQWMITRALRYY